MKIVLIKEDFDNDYKDTLNCPIASALKRSGIIKYPLVGSIFKPWVHDKTSGAKLYEFIPSEWNNGIYEEQKTILKSNPDHTFTVQLKECTI